MRAALFLVLLLLLVPRRPAQRQAPLPSVADRAYVASRLYAGLQTDFAMPFADNGRGTLVGEPTAGSSGQPLMLDLGHDLMALIGAKRERFPDGSVFEGVGIAPDVPVTLRIQDVQAGRDSVLERALAVSRGGT